MNTSRAIALSHVSDDAPRARALDAAEALDTFDFSGRPNVTIYAMSNADLVAAIKAQRVIVRAARAHHATTLYLLTVGALTTHHRHTADQHRIARAGLRALQFEAASRLEAAVATVAALRAAVR